VFAPLNVNSAVPVFTSEPVPLITPEKAVSTDPPNVNTFACKFTAPDPATDATVSDPPNFSVPEAPTVTASASNNALPPDNVNVPPFTVADPLNVFAPLKVNSADPVFTNDPVPLITPENVVFAEPPNVSVFAKSPTEPAPANVPNVSDAPSPNVAPDATVTATPSANAAPPDNVSVPALTAAAPVNVFAPPSVNSPAPAFVKPNPPETTPLNVTPDATFRTVSADNATPPDNVNAPLFVTSPNPIVPVAFGLKTNAFASARAVAP
jgi:hypothetical protein